MPDFSQNARIESINIAPPYIGLPMNEARAGRYWVLPEDIISVTPQADNECEVVYQALGAVDTLSCFTSPNAIEAARATCKQRWTEAKYHRDPTPTKALVEGFIDAHDWLNQAFDEERSFVNCPNDPAEFIDLIYKLGARWVYVSDDGPDADQMLIGLPADPQQSRPIVYMLNHAYVSDKRPHTPAPPHVFWIWWD